MNDTVLTGGAISPEMMEMLPKIFLIVLTIAAAVIIAGALKNLLHRVIVIIIALIISGTLTVTMNNGKPDLEYNGTSVTDTIVDAGEKVGITGETVKEAAGQITDSMKQGAEQSGKIVQDIIEKNQK